MKYLTTLMIVSLALLIVPSVAHANLLVNPSFENGTDPNADNWTMLGDDGSGNWGLGNGTEKKTGWGSETGAASAIIVGKGVWGRSGTGFAFQTVAAASSTPYAYSIWANTDGNGAGTGTYYMKLEWYNGGGLVSADTQNINLVDGWTQYSFNVTSPSAVIDSAHVIFGQTDGTCASVTKWDDASFDTTSIPEPTSLLLLGSGLIGLVGLGRKSKK